MVEVGCDHVIGFKGEHFEPVFKTLFQFLAIVSSTHSAHSPDKHIDRLKVLEEFPFPVHERNARRRRVIKCGSRVKLVISLLPVNGIFERITHWGRTKQPLNHEESPKSDAEDPVVGLGVDFY